MPEDMTTNEQKSRGAKRRWGESSKNALKNDVDKSAKRYEFKCFDGLGLSKMQKQFIVTYMDSPFFGRKENRHAAYKKVFNPSTDGSLRSNCSALLSKSKVVEGIRKYQIFSLQSHKLEVTTESIENLRKRANYSVDTFFTKDGEPIPLDKIDKEWLICIDNIEKDRKSNAGKGIIETTKYKLCDRDKASTQLQKLLGVFQEMESINVSVPVSEGKNALEDKTDSGPRKPRVTFTIGVDE